MTWRAVIRQQSIKSGSSHQESVSKLRFPRRFRLWRPRHARFRMHPDRVRVTRLDRNRRPSSTRNDGVKVLHLILLAN